MNVRFTPRALSELDHLLEDLSARSRQAASNLRNRLRQAMDLIGDHPHIGMKTDAGRLRRILLTPHPYVVFYEPGEEEIIVVGIRHGARDPSSMPGSQGRSRE